MAPPLTWQQRNPGENRSYSAVNDPEWQAKAWRQLQQGSSPSVLSRVQGTAGMSDGSYLNPQRFANIWSPRNQSRFNSNPGDPGFDPLPKDKGWLGDLGDWAGGNVGTILDALGTGYDIWQNESFKKPMMLEEHKRAGELHGMNMDTLRYNLAGAKRDEGRNVQNQVRLWNNLSRKEGEAERTIENWTPTTYA